MAKKKMTYKEARTKENKIASEVADGVKNAVLAMSGDDAKSALWAAVLSLIPMLTDKEFLYFVSSPVLPPLKVVDEWLANLKAKDPNDKWDVNALANYRAILQKFYELERDAFSKLAEIKNAIE